MVGGGGVVVGTATDRSTTAAAGTETGGDVVVVGGAVVGGDVVVGATGAATEVALVSEASFQAGTGPPRDPDVDDDAPDARAGAEPPRDAPPPLGVADAVELF